MPLRLKRRSPASLKWGAFYPSIHSSLALLQTRSGSLLHSEECPCARVEERPNELHDSFRSSLYGTGRTTFFTTSV
eukprot:c25097_g1_i2 orf=2-226(-)